MGNSATRPDGSNIEMFTDTVSLNVNHPEITTFLGTTPDWSAWDGYIVPIVAASDSQVFSKPATFDPTKIVNSMEGIFTTGPEHVDGYKSWIDFPQNMQPVGDPYPFPSDPVYGTDDGKVYMHLSFLGPGKDLVPDALDLSNAEITGHNSIAKHLQGIWGGGAFTKSRKDGLDNGWAFGSDWDSPQVIECESSDNATGTPGPLVYGYDTSSDYEDRHNKQWRPEYNINGDTDGKILNFVQQLFIANSKFKFSGDTDNEVYTIKSVTKKFLYNHTPWKRRYVKKSSRS